MLSSPPRHLGALALTAILSACGSSAPPMADPEEAEICLQTKIWDGYDEHWALRSLFTTTMGSGETSTHQVTLYSGTEMQFLGCGDPATRQLSLLLHDADGALIARSQGATREPTLRFTPSETGTYYVTLYARELVTPSHPAGVGLAITYR